MLSPIASRTLFACRGSLRSAAIKPLSTLTRGLATVTDSPISISQKPSAPSASTVQPQSGPACLKLKTGQIFHGESFGAPNSTFGEAVFTTSLVGYPESMTDPSYRGQILVFTQPLIGNYGVPGSTRDEFGLLRYFESEKIQVQGIIVNDYATHYSHWTAVESLGEWCARYGVPAISGVDTRAIVHLLREQGSTLAHLSVGEKAINENIETFPNPNERNLVAEVSVREPVEYNPKGDVRIAVIDCGIKQNILRCLVGRGAAVTLLPWNYDVSKIADEYDGVFISNGPGDPTKCVDTVQHLRQTLEFYDRPVFGICMGNLLLGMAAGLDVYKLRFGNRGHNQPAIDLTTGRCVITSQNHGYALRDDQMPAGWEKYFVNANDGSNEGIRHTSRPVRSVQFHPEAKGGPQDTEYLFTEFLNEVRAYKAHRVGIPVFVENGVKVTASVA
ncbi:uncharacterized protein VTP21DRAFT_807 [Calcarisporiella thermophila]|uniref:uncharacterized protein n=1 Tax=Calcarisporiella thermophila TaxID=911321 RepID=UPI003742C0E1